MALDARGDRSGTLFTARPLERMLGAILNSLRHEDVGFAIAVRVR